MRVEEIERAVEAVARERDDVVLAAHPLRYRHGEYRFLRLASTPVRAAEPVLVLRAGVHGDETSGPLTVARHLGEIVEYAHRRGVRLVVYPLANPSGYALARRYNADGDRGTDGNNDFLRYEMEDGDIRGSLDRPGDRFRRFVWASDPSLAIALPLETRLMHRLLRLDPLGQVRGVLDLHQDHLTPGAPPGTYCYAFGPLDVYAPIVERIRRVCPVLAGWRIAAGFSTRVDGDGRPVGIPDDRLARTADDDGLIVRHDGTFTDLLYRLGARHALAPETTGATAMDQAVAVNRAWFAGLVVLLARERDAGPTPSSRRRA